MCSAEGKEILTITYIKLADALPVTGKKHWRLG